MYAYQTWSKNQLPRHIECGKTNLSEKQVSFTRAEHNVEINVRECSFSIFDVWRVSTNVLHFEREEVDVVVMLGEEVTKDTRGIGGAYLVRG